MTPQPRAEPDAPPRGAGRDVPGADWDRVLVFTTLDVDSSYRRFGTGALMTGVGLTRGAFGIAVLGSVVNGGYRDDVAPALARCVEGPQPQGRTSASAVSMPATSARSSPGS